MKSSAVPWMKSIGFSQRATCARALASVKLYPARSLATPLAVYKIGNSGSPNRSCSSLEKISHTLV